MAFNRYGFDLTDEKDDTSVGVLLLAGVVYSAYMLLSEAFVITKLWGWFLVPAGLPSIGIKVCVVGLLIVALTRNKYKGSSSPKETGSDGHRATALAIHLLWPWIALFIGWCMT